MSDSRTFSPEIALLYSQYHQWLVRWIYRRINSHSSAADLAQDTFIRVLNRPHLVKDIREPQAWLASIARGLIVDRARRQKLELAWQELQAELPEDEMPSPEEGLVFLQLLERIDAILAGLNPKVRTAFLLSRLEGFTYSQIAETLGVSVSSVEKYMMTAVRHCVELQQDL